MLWICCLPFKEKKEPLLVLVILIPLHPPVLLVLVLVLVLVLAGTWSLGWRASSRTSDVIGTVIV